MLKIGARCWWVFTTHVGMAGRGWRVKGEGRGWEGVWEWVSERVPSLLVAAMVSTASARAVARMHGRHLTRLGVRVQHNGQRPRIDVTPGVAVLATRGHGVAETPSLGLVARPAPRWPRHPSRAPGGGRRGECLASLAFRISCKACRLSSTLAAPRKTPLPRHPCPALLCFAGCLLPPGYSAPGHGWNVCAPDSSTTGGALNAAFSSPFDCTMRRHGWHHCGFDHHYPRSSSPTLVELASRVALIPSHS